MFKIRKIVKDYSFFCKKKLLAKCKYKLIKHKIKFIQYRCLSAINKLTNTVKCHNRQLSKLSKIVRSLLYNFLITNRQEIKIFFLLFTHCSHK